MLIVRVAVNTTCKVVITNDDYDYDYDDDGDGDDDDWRRTVITCWTHKLTRTRIRAVRKR